MWRCGFVFLVTCLGSDTVSVGVRVCINHSRSVCRRVSGNGSVRLPGLDPTIGLRLESQGGPRGWRFLMSEVPL